MIFENKEVYCILEVLKLLGRGKSKYSVMFKKTRVSHSTLQSVLKELVERKFVLKHNKGHQNVDYEISEKGQRLLHLLVGLKKISS